MLGYGARDERLCFTDAGVLSATVKGSFRIGTEVYHVGVLPWWIHVDLWFMDYPYVATLIIFVLAFLLAVWIRQWFRIKARARLRMHEV